MSDTLRICKVCGYEYEPPLELIEPRFIVCPDCGSKKWELKSLRVRSEMPGHEPLATPVRGSSADYMEKGR